MTDKTLDKNGKRTVVKGLCFVSVGMDSNTIEVDLARDRIVRIRPLHYDRKYGFETLKPWEMKARGKSIGPSRKSLIPPFSLAYKNRIFSPNRILYPLRRVDWDPDGDRNPQNRGKSGYVRISWDEALDAIAREMKRIKEEYGPHAILSQSDGHGETGAVHSPHGTHRRLLRLFGGYTLQCRNTDSWEGWWWGAKHVWGMENLGQQMPATNVMLDIARNADWVLFWGCDPETTSWGFTGQMASRMCYWFTELGIKSIYICPDLNYGAAIHADKWIPIRPNTDAALHLAIAHVWITEGIYDKEYVAGHVVGFDKFEEYVLGKEDGTPKTPRWAAEITGIPSRIIKALARKWATKRVSIAHGNGGPMIRGPYSTESGRLEVILLGMQGLGRPGCHQVKMQEWALYSQHERNPMPRSSLMPVVFAADRGWSGPERLEPLPKQLIPKNRIHDAILHPPLTWYGKSMLSRDPVDVQFEKYTYPAEGCSEVHMIWADTASWITSWNDTNTYIKALRSPKIEFILSQHPWLENDAQFADIILPTLTKFEVEDIGVEVMSGQFNTIFIDGKCIEPLGESKSGYETTCLIAERLGLLEEYTEGKSVDEWIRAGFETSGAAEHISFEELKEKGYWVAPPDPKWEEYPAGLIGFHDDPEKNRLQTPSGKLEFYSRRLAEHFPGDKERPPVPHFVPFGESHQESLLHPRSKTYPLLIVSNHPRWRVHSQHDDMIWLREIPTCKVRGPDGYAYEPLWIHPVDAKKRDIAKGDVVTVFNERGAVLAGAYITERIMPGCVYMDHGARYDPIVPGELDRGGAINTITPHNTTSRNATGMVASGFLVEAEKTDLEGLREKYPDAFGKPYHREAGLVVERLVRESPTVTAGRDGKKATRRRRRGDGEGKA